MARFDARRLKQRTSAGSLWVPEQLETRLLLSANPLQTSVTPRIELSNATKTNAGASTTLASGLSPLTATEVSGRSVTLNVIPGGGDASTLRYTWQTVESPAGGSVSFARNSSNAAKDNTLTFSRAGTYRVKAIIQSSGGTASEVAIQLNVILVATSLSATTSTGKLLSSTTQTLNGVAERLAATVLDQFGRAMADQPAVSWQVVKSPISSSPTLTADGNAVSVEFNRVGSYTLRALSGSLKLDGAINVASVLTSFTFSTADGNPVTTGQTLTVTTANQRLNFRCLDQFGNVITAPPALKWTTTIVPNGGKFSTTLTNGVLNVTYSKVGQYTLATTIGGQAFSFSSNVVATLTSLSVLTTENRIVGLKSPLSVTGTSQQLTAIALDQYGVALLEQPEVTWQSTAVPLDGTATLSTNGNAVSVGVTRAGIYGLRASAGSAKTELSLNYTQSLTVLSLATTDGTAVESGGSVTVTAAALQLSLRGLDQFGQTMKTLPTSQWSTTLSPTGATALSGLSSGLAKYSFTRAGMYSIRIQNGTTSFSFTANVVPTLTALRVLTTNNQNITANGTMGFSGTTLGLSAKGLDQFGGVMEEQPVVSWQSITSPSGGSATLTADGNNVSVTMTRDGKYSLRAQSGAVTFNFAVTVGQTLSAISLLSPAGEVLNDAQPFTVNTTTQKFTVRGIDQFGNAVATLPNLVWTITTSVAGGKASVALSSGVATLTVNRVGNYSITASLGSVRSIAAIQVVPAVTSLAVTGSDGRVVNPSTAISVTGTAAVLNAVVRDQFGEPLVEQPQINWTTLTSPTGVQVALTTKDNEATYTFNRAGAYTARARIGNLALDLRFNVTQTATRLVFAPSSSTIVFGGTRQLSVNALDQFDVPLTSQPLIAWSSTGGTISSKGLFVAGQQAGAFRITASSGALSSSLNFEVVAPVAPTGLTDPALAELVNTYYGDGQLDRQEMIQILRSAGSDGTVNAAELTDFRFLVSSNTPFSMPNYVRSLAGDVVNSNPANRSYKGLTAGNLAVGSGGTLLNNLVDKWFLGTDLPQISGSSLTYQTTIGNLFNGTPSRAETRQGQLGDCYFIAALGAIADKNPDAVRNLFIDNGDGTYTVRFYAGTGSGSAVPDYVTVNRKLPAYSNGTLGYSGYGQSVSSASTTLWIALAEKAYAQWNETGNEGRDGTNRYSAIEGGWMFNVNAQVLGYNSTNTYFATNNKQTLISALASNQAVTLGTLPSATAGGLYGSHAYIVTGYNSSTDTFSLHNPWGVAHPTPLTWAQLQANCSIFVATATSSVSNGVASTGSGKLSLSPSFIAVPSTTSIDTRTNLTTSRTLEASQDIDSVIVPLRDEANASDFDNFDTSSRPLDSCLSGDAISEIFGATDTSDAIDFLMLNDQLLDIAFMDLDLIIA